MGWVVFSRLGGVRPRISERTHSVVGFLFASCDVLLCVCVCVMCFLRGMWVFFSPEAVHNFGSYAPWSLA